MPGQSREQHTGVGNASDGPDVGPSGAGFVAPWTIRSPRAHAATLGSLGVSFLQSLSATPFTRDALSAR